MPDKYLTFEQLAQRLKKEMLAKLRNREAMGWGGWKAINQEHAMRRLGEEMAEFFMNPSWQEAADVANFMVFICNLQEEADGC